MFISCQTVLAHCNCSSTFKLLFILIGNIRSTYISNNILFSVGMDEEAHWLVCEDGLKKRCEQSLRCCTITDLGFIRDGNTENENHYSVHGYWREHSLNSQHSLAVVEG